MAFGGASGVDVGVAQTTPPMGPFQASAVSQQAAQQHNYPALAQAVGLQSIHPQASTNVSEAAAASGQHNEAAHQSYSQPLSFQQGSALGMEAQRPWEGVQTGPQGMADPVQTQELSFAGEITPRTALMPNSNPTSPQPHLQDEPAGSTRPMGETASTLSLNTLPGFGGSGTITSAPDVLHIIQVHVQRSNRIKQSFIVERPVVRLHVVSKATGRYFSRQGMVQGQVLSHEEQHTMLQAPGHDTLMTVHRDGKFCVGTLDYVPPTQTQETPLLETVAPNGDCIWREPLLVDLDFGLIEGGEGGADDGGALILFEILQHPPTMKTWQKHRKLFTDGVHRVAWAFLDVTDAVRPHLARPMHLQLFRWPPKLQTLASKVGDDPRSAGPVYDAYRMFTGQPALPGRPATGGGRTGLWRARSADGPPVTSRRAPKVEAFPAALHVQIQPVERFDLHDPATLQLLLQSGRVGTRLSLPSGYGSGWDNYRLTAGDRTGQALAQTAEERDSEVRARFKAALERRLLEPVVLPNAFHARQPIGSFGCSVCAFSHDGLSLAVAVEHSARHFTIQVFDVATFKLLFKFDGHQVLVYELSWSADDRVLVSCGSDCTAKVWLLDAARAAQLESSHPHAVNFTLRPMTANTVTQGTSYGVATPFCTVLNHPSYIYSCAFHPAAATPPLFEGGVRGGWAGAEEGLGRRIPFLLVATACCNGCVYLWNASLGYEPMAKLVVCESDGADESAAVNAVVWDPAAVHHRLGSLRPSLLYTGDAKGWVKEWPCRIAEEECRFEHNGCHPSRFAHVKVPITCMSLNPSGSRIVTLTKADKVVVIDRKTMEVIALLQGVKCCTHPLKFALDPDRGRWLATGSEDGRVCLFDLDSGHVEPRKHLVEGGGSPEAAGKRGGPRDGRGQPVYCVAWNPKLQVMAFCSRHAGGHISVLYHDKSIAASQPGRSVFTEVSPTITPEQIAAMPPAGALLERQTRRLMTDVAAKYNVPEKLECHYIRGLLSRIREDLLAKGFLKPGDTHLTGRHEEVSARMRKNSARTKVANLQSMPPEGGTLGMAKPSGGTQQQTYGLEDSLARPPGAKSLGLEASLASTAPQSPRDTSRSSPSFLQRVTYDLESDLFAE